MDLSTTQGYRMKHMFVVRVLCCRQVLGAANSLTPGRAATARKGCLRPPVYHPMQLRFSRPFAAS
jgi:hypothetical protein